MTSDHIRAPHPRRPRNKGRDQQFRPSHGGRPRNRHPYPPREHRQGRRQGYPIGYFIRCYVVAVVIVAMSTALLPPLIVFTYPAAGFALNRTILPYVRWHHFTVTLQDVATAKVLALLFWPYSYFVFIVQLLIDRYL